MSIAIVDDEIEITMLFSDALRQITGLEYIYTFNDPIIALEDFTANNKNYAVFLTDLRMPSLNGIGLIKKIRDMSPLTRTLLMSAFEVESDITFQKYIKDDTINGFLKKPIHIQDLCTEVSKQIHIHRYKNKRSQRLFNLSNVEL